jgi:urea transport system substrate-binding protein
VLKGTVAGEEYFPLGHTQFNSVINCLRAILFEVRGQM